MNKTLTANELEHLLAFIGYGRLDADIWFLGFEESGGKVEELITRINFDEIMDSVAAQTMLGRSSQIFGSENLQGAWKGISEVMLKLEGKKPSAVDIEHYYADSLGRNDGGTLLVDFMPIPVPANDGWVYEELIPQYESRQAYYSEVKPMRMELMSSLIKQNLPKIIIGYGQANWTDYQELFSDYKLAPNGPFMLGWDANTVVVLCDHFSMGNMDGKYDDLVALILENSLSIETVKPTGPIPLSKAEIAQQKKEAARKASAAKRKPSAQHNASDPYCVCAYCLGYEKE